MHQDTTALCRDCGAEYAFTAAEQEALASQGLPVYPPARCPACREKRAEEDRALLEAAKANPALAHSYRCRRCRRVFLLLRPWRRAGGLLFCPVCRPGMYRSMPCDEALNEALGYPQ
ncbi:MAG: zinc-ribbon domain containing protein [Clostridia bacterium]|nr:zinc-ribbon domain containing protein [Clostridia bacterium]